MIDQYEGGDFGAFAGLTTETDRGMGRRVIIKRYKAESGGNTALGVAPTKTFNLIETQVNLKLMTGKDILAQGGIYALGDVQMKGRLPIFGANGKTGQNVDTMIFDGMQYQQVGIPFPVPGGGGTIEYQSTWRKVAS